MWKTERTCLSLQGLPAEARHKEGFGVAGFQGSTSRGLVVLPPDAAAEVLRRTFVSPCQALNEAHDTARVSPQHPLN